MEHVKAFGVLYSAEFFVGNTGTCKSEYQQLVHCPVKSALVASDGLRPERHRGLHLLYPCTTP